MSGPENLALWKANRIAQRLKLVEECISEVSRSAISFKYISDLAKYLASQVALKERSSQNSETKIKATAKTIRYTTLLRAPYRPLLDELIPVKQRNESLDIARRQLHKANTEILTMSNELQELKENNIKLQSELDHLKKGKYYSITTPPSDIDSLYLVIKRLLRAFQEFYYFEDEKIVEATPLRNVIIPRELMLKVLKLEEGRNLFDPIKSSP